MGPDFVCVCCHCLMYKQNLVPCNKSKYTKASNELLDHVLNAENAYTNVAMPIQKCPVPW